MKKMLVLLFVFAAISASAHAAITQFKLTVVSTQSVGKIQIFNKTNISAPVKECFGTTPCTFTFITGTKVAITPHSGSVDFAFHGWGPVGGSATPCASQTAATCNFTITADSSATAKIDYFPLLRVQLGTGSGTVRVRKGTTGFDCTNAAPLSCIHRFFVGTALTIHNIPGPNQIFDSYSNKTGSMQTCTTNICNFTLTEDSSLVSNFIQIP